MECGEHATWMVTKHLAGTSTHVAKQRTKLVCKLPKGHEGPHRDPVHGKEWRAEPGRLSTVLEHED